MHPIFSRPSPVGLAAFIPGLLIAFFHLSIASASTPTAALPDIRHMVKEGLFPQALDKVDSYISAKPKDVAGRFLKGVILTEMGRVADAIAVFSRLTEDFPALPEPYNNLAVLYAQQKQYDKARNALEMAIKTHPSYSVAHENLGDIYAKLASQSYDRALQRDSSHTVTQSPLSLIRELGSSAPKENSANVSSNSAQATPKSVPDKVAARVAVQQSPEVSVAHASQVHPVTLGNGVGDADVAKIFQHWSSAWSRMDFRGAIGYFISDLTCRIVREKISSPGLVTESTGSGATTGCRSELRKSRFW